MAPRMLEMPALRLGSPFWLDGRTSARSRRSPLRGRHTADVVIVGGGITGCACALLAARSGARVILVEADRLGRASTAASTALLMHEPDVDFTELAARYGANAAAAIWRAGRRGVRDFVATLQRLEPASRTRRVPSIYFTQRRESERGLERELNARQRAGVGGRWLSAEALADRTGITGVAAIETIGNAELDPYRACLALARGAAQEGAAVHEHSRVKRIRADRRGVTVSLDRASIRAGQVVIATGYATTQFRPLTGRFRLVHTYVITTPVLPQSLRRRLGLGAAMLWDTERPYHYLRWTPDQRLIFGGRDRPHTGHRNRHLRLATVARDLSTDLERLYPLLRGVRPDYAWEGLFANTPDSLPYVGAHRRYPRHLFALGYGGNGMTFAFLAAQILSRQLGGGAPRDEDALFAFNRKARRR